MVEAVGNDGVLLAHQRLEHAAVGVETGGEYDRVVLAEVSGDRVFKLAMQRCVPQINRTDATPKPNTSIALFAAAITSG